MKYFSLLILSLFFLQITTSSQPIVDECTIGVAHGSATTDGRPLAWKTRDYDHIDHRMKYIDNSSYDYKYIIIEDILYSNYPTAGSNEKGLVIFKSNADDLDPAPSGPSDGAVMRHALGYCRTIDEFQLYLDSTNITGRAATGNFAMIDSTGAAVIFEIEGYEYWKFDAADAPDGYIIRTNFALNGGGNNGLARYNRSSDLVADFHSGDSLNYKSLLRYQMRDFSNHNSEPYPIPFLDQYSGLVPYGYFPTHYSICRKNSVSAAVIQGVLPDENPELTTMWAILGQPAAAVFCPYWPIGDPPYVASGSSSKAPLCDIAIDIRECFFDLADHPFYINSHLLRDTIGGGLWTCTFPTEDLIMDSTEAMLNNWRLLDSIPVTAMLEFENDMAEMAYYELTDCYNFLTTRINEPILDKKKFRLYPNPATHTISLVSQAGIELTSLEILDVQGRVLMHEVVTNDNLTFNVSNLPQGLYFIRIYNSKGIETQKLIIQ